MGEFLVGALVGAVAAAICLATMADVSIKELKNNNAVQGAALHECVEVRKALERQSPRPTSDTIYTFPKDPRETPPVPPPPPLNCVRQIAAARAQRDNAATVWAESVMCAKPECLRAVITSQAEFKDADDALRVLEAAQVAGRAPCAKE